MFYTCNFCTELFSRKDYLKRHTQQQHELKSIKRYHCSSYNNNHDNCFHNLPQITQNGLTRIVFASALKNALRHLRIYPNSTKKYLPEEFLNKVKPLLESTLEILKNEKQLLKLSCKLCVLFTKINNSEMNDESYFSSHTVSIQDININVIFEQILYQIEQYTTRGSNWIIDKTLFLELAISVYK